MMRIAALTTLAAAASATTLTDDNTLCIACEVVFTLVEEKMLLGDELCEKPDCRALLDHLGVDSVEGLNPDRISPDTYCHSVLGACDNECVLFSEWPIVPHPPSPDALPVNTKEGKMAPGDAAVAMTQAFVDGLGKLPNVQCGEDWDCLYNKFTEDHLTMQDSDLDLFAPSFEQFRNTHWRGKDCDDTNSAIHPGALPLDGDATVDSNCNGIFGGNSTGSYEDLFCADYESVGIAILGDSATAHFHIPPQWLEASDWSLAGLIPDAMDELDFPQCSWGTGHVPSDECPSLHGGQIDSLYLRLKERNACMHRDFQNLGTNGASVKNTQRTDPDTGVEHSYLVDSLARDHDADKPMLVVYSLIGNDVCGSHSDVDHMTDLDTFTANVESAMDQLDTFLPPNSHVLTIGLVDGRVLYDTMHTSQHPVGDTYPDFYTFLNCLDMNPCAGWLNTNETIRNATSEHAALLNTAYTSIQAKQDSGEKTWENFEMKYFYADWPTYIQEFVDQGGDPVNLIEWSDGFHPSGLGMAVMAADIWEWLEAEWPEAIGDANPNNDAIKELFGDQGGY